MSEKLELHALDLGLTKEDIAGILIKWGPAVLKIVISALQSGFTWAFIKEILLMLGPAFLVSAVHTKHVQLTCGAIIQGDGVTTGAEATNPLSQLLLQLIINVLQSPESTVLIQMFIDWVLGLLQDTENHPKVIAALTVALNNAK